MDEYNISLGGNISNLVYWGMTVWHYRFQLLSIDQDGVKA